MEAEDRRRRKEREYQKAVRARISKLEAVAITKANGLNLTDQSHLSSILIGILIRP